MTCESWQLADSWDLKYSSFKRVLSQPFLQLTMEKADAAFPDDALMKDAEQQDMTTTCSEDKTDEDRLKFAPIYGPVVTSPQQYIPAGYCLLECSRCGGVDGMQRDIDICVYCADKKLEMNTKGAREKTESKNQYTQTETVSSICK